MRRYLRSGSMLSWRLHPGRDGAEGVRLLGFVRSVVGSTVLSLIMVSNRPEPEWRRNTLFRGARIHGIPPGSGIGDPYNSVLQISMAATNVGGLEHAHAFGISGIRASFLVWTAAHSRP